MSGRKYRNLNDYNSNTNNSLPSTQQEDSCLKQWNHMKTQNTTNPEKWGPQFWFILHNAAAHYPEVASPICANRVKGFILGIPYMLPCQSCAEDANYFINSHADKLDEICSSKENIFEFFRQFHNYVNTKTEKPQMSKEQAQALYKY
jgi:hypothetical protein